MIKLAMSLADRGFRNDLPSTTTSTGRSGSVLGGPGHLGSVLGAGVEAGAVVLAAVFTTQLYRRAFLVIQLLIGAALALGVTAALQLLHDRWLDVDALATALRFLGVLAMGGARVGLGVVTVEVVPTIARCSGVGLCAALAAVGEMCAPLLAVVAELTYPSVPWVISATSCLVAALLALLLPETSGTTLPDVVEEAEVIGLWIRGEVIKSCDSAYGRSPFWVEVDGLIVSRSVSDVGPDEDEDDDDERFSSLERIFDSERPTTTTTATSKFGRGAGPSHLMVLPHVHARRKGMGVGSSHSSDSLPSSGSIVSLVDVSKINGNNSDTTDSNSSADQAHSRDFANDKKERSSTENNELATESQDTGFNHRSDDRRVSGKKRKSEGIEDQEEFSTSGDHSTYSIENDVSISVCSLKFKHIRRPVSPTDRRMRTQYGYSIRRTTSERRESKTLMQEYISRNISSSKEDISAESTTSLTEASPTEAPVVSRRTKPSAVLQECLRIARNKEKETEEANEIKTYISKKPTVSASKNTNNDISTNPKYLPLDDGPPTSSQSRVLIPNSQSTNSSVGHGTSRVETERTKIKRENSAITMSKSLSQPGEGNSANSLAGSTPLEKCDSDLLGHDTTDDTTHSDVREQDFVFRKAIVMTDLDETNL